jgi:hypothetical protein
MSSVVIHGGCALVVLSLSACAALPAEGPRNPNAQARNARSQKKAAKQRRPLVAPPPAYGNKIVLDHDADCARSEGDPSAESACL